VRKGEREGGKEREDEGEGGARLISFSIPDGDLFSLVLSLDRYSESFGAKIIKQAARVVNHLHGLDIVHRDLQPKNWYCYK
jgi:serine/threonine protein kinase